MKVTYKVINRSELELCFENKRMIIEGEILVTTPRSFRVSFFTIRKWEPPYEKEEVSDGEKYRIIKALLEESRKQGNVDLFFD